MLSNTPRSHLYHSTVHLEEGMKLKSELVTRPSMALGVVLQTYITARTFE